MMYKLKFVHKKHVCCLNIGFYETSHLPGTSGQANQQNFSLTLVISTVSY